ncbi:Gfo/Idh/MocA family protein [Actinomadura namibiensis]|uniref:Gfo/Idh/MocA family protein n=1 Tax=Actinomadura kijaniata TaxID=46161 RepID=UPI00361EB502
MSDPQRVAIVGTGARAQMYTRALAERDHTRVVALSDVNPTRARLHNRILTDEHGRAPATFWHPDDVARMLDAERVDTLVVCTVDAQHARHILTGLEAGRRVVTEKPMVTTAGQARRVLDAADRTGGDLAVAFNYRFNPLHRAVRDLLAAGAIGRVLSVHFEWLLDVRHGADYFRRWHRDRASSGGLAVHKSGHHFDLVNWWLDAAPVTVYGAGWRSTASATASATACAATTPAPTAAPRPPATRSPSTWTPTPSCAPSTWTPNPTTATSATATSSPAASRSRTTWRWSSPTTPARR